MQNVGISGYLKINGMRSIRFCFYQTTFFVETLQKSFSVKESFYTNQKELEQILINDTRRFHLIENSTFYSRHIIITR